VTSNDPEASPNEVAQRAAERIAAIGRAQAEARPADIVAGVKEIVGREVAELSPDAKLVTTTYFNHTYMPDFVLEWTDRGKTSSRPIFIRNSITPFSAPRDIDALGQQEPVLLGLAPLEDEETRSAVQASFTEVAERPGPGRAHTGRMLVSDLSSIAGLADDRWTSSPDSSGVGDADDLDKHHGEPETDSQEQTDSADAETASGRPPSPLRTLVRANILRGGRGLLTAAEVATVNTTADLNPGDPGAAKQIETFTSMAAALFEEAAATRLVRAADIIRLALTTGSDEAVLAQVEGELADSDLRVLLPYLLGRRADIANEQFWAYIGSLMSLARLEEFADELTHVSIEPLVKANLSTWRARRAGVTFNPDFDPDDHSVNDQPDDGISTRWAMRSGLLTATAGRWLLTLTAKDGRRIRGRDDGRLPAWSAVDSVATRYKLDEIELRGVVRRVRLSARESGDVAGDVRRINETLEDSYTVDDVAVRALGSDSDAPMLVEFAGSTVTVRGQSTETIEDMAEASMRFLTHQNPIEEARLNSLLGRPVTTETTSADDDQPDANADTDHGSGAE